MIIIGSSQTIHTVNLYFILLTWLRDVFRPFNRSRPNVNIIGIDFATGHCTTRERKKEQTFAGNLLVQSSLFFAIE